MSTRERLGTKRHFPNTYESGENADDHKMIKKKGIKNKNSLRYKNIFSYQVNQKTKKGGGHYS